ncbi:molybdenum cofactor guanylyltransferase [Pseudoxanthomonas dokdonensis]|uniref:MobA-like NTP transferase domain-containing protein n=1 Tax=Pseudoxanthomonas dokdonensis TaxID=344882 RepID=A0A0R0CQ94_9GAMM|nr:molybdenum cofactor guanylyltransferase [Pseudoxanthomonas dokdonensis]KRG71526.1 hypothetical protein ABB29_01770 [Pseudoxanthomonas dokdonensis]
MRGLSSEGCGGLILAGGQSSRMGRDKAMLDWRGQPLLLHMQALLQQAGCTPILISGDYPQYSGIADQDPGMGPLGGLATLLPRMADGHWLLVPVDMPRLDPQLLTRLRQAPAAACVCFQDQVLPMRLQVDASLRALLPQLMALPPRQRSLRALQHALSVQMLPLPADAQAGLAACNTPAQWRDMQP